MATGIDLPSMAQDGQRWEGTGRAGRSGAPAERLRKPRMKTAVFLLVKWCWISKPMLKVADLNLIIFIYLHIYIYISNVHSMFLLFHCLKHVDTTCRMLEIMNFLLVPNMPCFIPLRICIHFLALQFGWKKPATTSDAPQPFGSPDWPYESDVWFLVGADWNIGFTTVNNG